VAVKWLPGLSDDVTRAHFDKELKAHITAQHVANGVCRLLGTCEKAGAMCLVMKLYECNLRDRITAGLDVGEVRLIGHTLSRTLVQLHAAGVIVKDIKPENVLMDEFGQPVLADFGISSVVTRTTCIMPTSIEGTFNYMAPELFQRGGYGQQVDVWALGCVIVEMCTGVRPWGDLQMQQIICAVCVDRVAPDVPDHAPEADVIRRCFAFEPQARPSAAELAAALAPEAVELPEVVGGMADAFARKVASLTVQITSAVAARANAEAAAERDRAARDRAVAECATAMADRERVAAELAKVTGELARSAASIDRLTAVLGRVTAERDHARAEIGANVREAMARGEPPLASLTKERAKPAKGPRRLPNTRTHRGGGAVNNKGAPRACDKVSQTSIGRFLFGEDDDEDNQGALGDSVGACCVCVWGGVVAVQR
jgi:hypothetical protein